MEISAFILQQKNSVDKHTNSFHFAHFYNVVFASHTYHIATLNIRGQLHLCTRVSLKMENGKNEKMYEKVE